MDLQVFLQNSFASILVLSRLKCVNPDPTGVVTFQSEAIRRVSHSTNNSSTTAWPALSALSIFFVRVIVSIATLSSIKVNTVKT
jgi:hypothetical protein